MTCLENNLRAVVAANANWRERADRRIAAFSSRISEGNDYQRP
jgi:hypothetical protein